MTGETDTQTVESGDTETATEVVVADAAAEPSADPRAVRNPGKPKAGKTVMVRHRGKADAPGLITSIDGSGLVTVALLQTNHAVVETVKHLAEIHPDDKLTGWYWPED